eukprot:Nk52_evm25s240 gene=Nk52_evmTU25s240
MDANGFPSNTNANQHPSSSAPGNVMIPNANPVNSAHCSNLDNNMNGCTGNSANRSNNNGSINKNSGGGCDLDISLRKGGGGGGVKNPTLNVKSARENTVHSPPGAASNSTNSCNSGVVSHNAVGSGNSLSSNLQSEAVLSSADYTANCFQRKGFRPSLMGLKPLKDLSDTEELKKIFDVYGSMNWNELSLTIRELENEAYKLGMEEKHELMRGKFLNLNS